MSNNGRVINDYLIKLLSLQQDGTQAISAPSNWTIHEPLLQVTTEVDRIIDRLSDELLFAGRDGLPASWHFFIGSPGNGKSAAIGRLSRLLRAKGCKILDEHDTDINDLDTGAVPYALRVFEKDNSYASAMIVQDASVVKDPYADKIDPAEELCHSLEYAWDKGISLIVCTNRGIIEKAYRERYLDPRFNTKTWFKVLRQLIENSKAVMYDQSSGSWDFHGRKTVFKKTTVSYSYLDNHSLLLGSNVFEILISKATDDDHWSSCEKCECKSLCPFKANREWLVNAESRQRFLQVLTRAEVISGQIIVFREGLALLSLILAGCPRDYVNSHPCEWVRRKFETYDICALAMRRIYMVIFSSFTGYGLECSQTLYDRQIQGLQVLAKISGKHVIDAHNLLSNVLGNPPPSSDVGVVRLLGIKGVMAQLDPWRESMSLPFLEKWDGELSVTSQCDSSLFTDIEKFCVQAWISLEELIESTLSHDSTRCYWALRRWSSNFLIHFGALMDGYTAWGYELDEFISIVRILGKDPSERTAHEKQELGELNKHLEQLLAAKTGEYTNHDMVQLSESVTLKGRWVTEKLRPRLRSELQSVSLTLPVGIRDEEESSLSSSAFVWLSRHLRMGLNAQCFPAELLTGIIDARVRAASKGKLSYAFDNKDVELQIITGDKENFSMARLYDGDVHVKRTER